MSDGTVIQAVQSVCATISIISCLCMGVKIWKEGTSNIANKMLSFLFILDFILALAYVVGRSAMPVHGFCQFQGLLIQWFSLAAIFWVVLMAFQMRQWIVAKKHPKRIEASMRNSMLFIVVSTGILAFSLLGAGAFGPAYMWCWIKHDYQIVRLLCFDVLLFASWALIAFFLWEVSISIGVRWKRSSMNARVLDLLNSSTSIQKKLMVYVGIFVAVWFFAILNRLIEWGLDRPVFATSLIQVLVLPLQGFFNALAFGDVLGFLSSMGISDQSTHSVVHNKDIKPTHTLREVLVEPPKTEMGAKKALSPHTKKQATKQYSVFITTLNMGEAPLLTILPDLPLWILEGHDVYAVGVQECLDLAGVMDAIHNHLGVAKYTRFTTSIGSGNTSLGYHGFIALMLFVRNTELKAGHIVPTAPSVSTMATGADLIVTTAQNKGAVGLPLQIHDTSICFVTCHLPSDSKGKSKLSKRNASAHSIMKGLTLAPEDVGFDLHLQHDHVLVFGDLNYRMDSAASGGGMGSLTGVAVACLIEKSAMNDDTDWLRRRYNLMRNPSDPLFPNIEEIKLLKAARASSKGAWSSVLRADELRSIMADGDAFSGFDEPMPCFPPSYKRKKGDAEGECGDYTDPLQIIQGFTNTGEVQELSRNGENEPQRQTIAAKKLRPPSYTDRILIHSLPDRQDRIAVQAYDFCDRLRVSDHRAVSMTIRLEVNTGVNFQNHTPIATPDAMPEATIDPKKEPKFQLYELSVSGLSVQFDSKGAVEEEEESGSEDEEEEGSGDEEATIRTTRSKYMDDDDIDALENIAAYNEYGGGGSPGGIRGSSMSSKKSVSIAQPDGVVGFVSDNPLHKNRTADAYLKKHRQPSGRGVKFAEDGSNDIEMSPQSSTTNTPSSSLSRPDVVSAFASSSGNSAADSNTRATTNRVSFGAPPPPAETSSSDAATSANTTANSTANTTSSSSATGNTTTSAPTVTTSPAPSPPPRPSPGPSASPAPGRGMPARGDSSSSVGEGGGRGGRGGMLSRAKSANAASFSNAKLDLGNDVPINNSAVVFTGVTETTVATTTSSSADDSAPIEISTARPRPVSRLSFLTHTTNRPRESDLSSVTSSNADEQVKPRISFDRSKSESAIDRTSLMKKSRSRSIFGVFLSSPKPVVDEQGDILNEISRDSFAWDSGEGVEGGQWKKKLAQDEAQRKLNKATSAKIVSKMKKTKKKLKNDKKVFQIVVVFPLPSKDPLLSHRKLFEYSSVYSILESEARAQQDLEKQDNNPTASHQDVTKESLLRPLSLFPWIEDRPPSGSRSRPGSSRMKAAQLSHGGDLEKGESGKSDASSTNSSSGAGSPVPVSSKLCSVTSNTYKVTGCASPELGAHVLLKLMNRSGYELGSAVVSLTHLLHTSTEEVRATVFPSIVISSGGQQRGTLTGKFSLKFLPSVVATSNK